MSGGYIKSNNKYCECVELGMGIMDVLQHDKFSISTLIHLLLSRDCETNSVLTSYSALSRELSMSESDIKTALRKLSQLGLVVLYKSENKTKIIIAIRRCNDAYIINGRELQLSEELIIHLSNGRNDKGYDKFRRHVLERDGYACQLCGSHKELEVHHKKSYAKYPQLRTSIGNGITLCRSCHDAVHRGECDVCE